MWSAENKSWRNHLIFITCIYLNESTLMAMIIHLFLTPVFLVKKLQNFPYFMVKIYIKKQILKTVFPIISKVIHIVNIFIEYVKSIIALAYN